MPTNEILLYPVTVAGVKATNQYLAGVTTLSAEFAIDPIDGILGMAYPAISNLKEVRACEV